MNINMTFFGQMLTFAVLIWVTMKFIWPPLNAAIEERQRKIAEGLAAADNSQKALEQAQHSADSVVRDARTKANEIIEQAHQRANQIVEQAHTEAVATANRQKDAAQAEIDAAANRAREELRSQVASLAVTGAEKVLRREIDANAHRALLDELAGQL